MVSVLQNGLLYAVYPSPACLSDEARLFFVPRSNPVVLARDLYTLLSVVLLDPNSVLSCCPEIYLVSSLYCIVMLFALAQSSCYWQPVPASELYSSLMTSQSQSHSQSLSSPSSPLSSSVPVPTAPIDGSVRLIDRCWCDFSFGLGTGAVNLFAPFDVERWEAKSMDRERSRRLRNDRELEKRNLLATTSSASAKDGEGEGENTTVLDALVKGANKTESVHIPGSVLNTAWGRVRSFVRTVPSSLLPSTPSPPPPAEPEPPAKEVPPPAPSEVVLPPWSVDLRPYGMGLVLDFGWERTR